MIDVLIRDFARAVKIAATATDKCNTIPILRGMKVRANGRLEIEATDLDMSARVVMPCETEGHDAGTVREFILSDPSSVLTAIGVAGGERATFDVIEGTGDGKDEQQGFSVRAGQLVRTARHGMSPENFPADRARIAEQHFSATLSVDALRQIERVAAAISTEAARYYLNGISMKRLDGWTYRFAATDGHRLMVVDIPLPDAAGAIEGDLILPRKFVQSVFTHFRKAEAPLIFKAGRGTVQNRTDSAAPAPAGLSRVAISGRVGEAEVSFYSKLIHGKYPDYGRVIPSSVEQSAIFDVTDVRRAILAVAGNTRKPGSPALAMNFDPAGVGITCAFGVEGVSAEYRIDCDHNVKPGFQIGFKPRYVLDILNAVRGDQVYFGFGGDDHATASPCLIRDVSDPDFMAVLMPIRL